MAGGGRGRRLFFPSCWSKIACGGGGCWRAAIRGGRKRWREGSKRLIEAKLAQLGLGEADGFKVYEKEIRTPGDGVIIFIGMQDHTAEAVKSLEGFRRAWIEEAQMLSHRSLALLRPTIRSAGSQ